MMSVRQLDMSYHVGFIELLHAEYCLLFFKRKLGHRSQYSGWHHAESLLMTRTNQCNTSGYRRKGSIAMRLKDRKLGKLVFEAEEFHIYILLYLTIRLQNNSLGED